MINYLLIYSESSVKKVVQATLTLYLLFGVFLLDAQTTPSEKLVVNASHIVYDGKIVLRWVPANYETWKWGNTYGYVVERFTTKRNGVALDLPEQYATMVVIEPNLKPLSEGEFEAAASNTPLMGVAGAALYSKEFDVTTTSANADWVNARNQVIEKENRYGYSLYAADQSGEVARAMALLAEDESFDPNDQYQYVVKPYTDPNEDSVPMERAFVAVDPSVTFSLPIIETLEATPGDKSVVLRWRKEGLTKIFNSYVVEKSENLAGPYDVVSGAGVVSMANDNQDAYSYFSNILAENKKPYYYRVAGHSPFGLLSDPSTPIEVIGVPPPLENAQPYITKTEEIAKGVLRLTWEFPDSKINNIKGFDVYKSETVDGIFTKINPIRFNPIRRWFEDDKLKSAAYYIVKVIDENDYEISSMTVLGQLKDNTPPAKPNGIKCSATKDGKVTIEWAKNTEEDLKGYRVFFSNDEVQAYTQLTAVPVEENMFQYDIGLNVLNKMAFYKVFALDYHENNSVYSDVCPMKRPDINPPSAPVLMQALPTYDGVKLKWIKSTSADLLKHELQRKLSYEADWHVVNDAELGDYTDITATKEKYYDYRVLAYDDADNISSSDILTVMPVYDGVLVAVGDASFVTPPPMDKRNVETAKYFKPDYVNIYWSFINGSASQSFKLYRADGEGGGKALIATLPISSSRVKYSYPDSKIKRGRFYVYSVMLCTDGSGCQPFGEDQPVFFRPKGGNKQSIGGFASTNHSNYNAKGFFPYKQGLMHFDMGGAIGTGQSLEIYRRGLYTQPMLKARLEANDAKWFWQDKSAAPGNDYVYEFKVCDNTLNLCHWSEMQTYIQFYPDPKYSVTHNYLPNYVQVQWGCDGAIPNAYYLITKSLTKGGGVVKSWKTPAPNVPNGDCRLPKDDIDVQLDGTYYYSIYLINAQGDRSIIKENIEVKY
jgi:uncharacterized protein